MGQRLRPSLVVKDMNCPPCMLCVYQPRNPPIEALGYFGRTGVFYLDDVQLTEDGEPHRLWHTPPQWPVACCEEEDLMMLEMVDPALADPSWFEPPGQGPAMEGLPGQ